MSKFEVIKDYDNDGWENPVDYLAEVSIQKDGYPKLLVWGGCDILNDDKCDEAIQLAEIICKFLNDYADYVHTSMRPYFDIRKEEVELTWENEEEAAEILGLPKLK